MLSDWDAYLLQAADLVVAGGRGLESFESTLQSLGAAGPAVALTLYNTGLYGQDGRPRTAKKTTTSPVRTRTFT